MGALFDSDLFGVRDHVACVTGASSGLGRALATTLVEAGARVVGVARRAEALQAWRDETDGETSEITGAEHIRAKHAANAEAGEKFMKIFQAYQDDVIFAHQTDDLSDSQPTKGNILGEQTIDQAGDALGHREFSMTKLYRNA